MARRAGIDAGEIAEVGWRVSVSIVAVFGFITSLVVWALLWAGSFTSYQNAATIVVILMTFVAIMGATWAPWGMRHSAERKA